MKKVKNEAKSNIKKQKNRLTKIFELPADSISGDFRMISLGNKDFYLENHHGVLEYTQKRLLIDTKDNRVLFMGKDILLKKMGRKNMIVEGDMDIIEFTEK